MTVAFTMDAKEQIASVSSDGTMRLWCVRTGHLQKRLELTTNEVVAIILSPDSKKLVWASNDCTVQLWDTSSGKAQQILCDRSDRVRAVAFSPDGKEVVLASDIGTIQLWNAATGELVRKFESNASKMAFS